MPPAKVAELGPKKSSRLSSWYYYEQYKSVFDDYTQFSDLQRRTEFASLQKKIDQAVRAHCIKHDRNYNYETPRTSELNCRLNNSKIPSRSSNKSSPSISVRTVIEKSDFKPKLKHEIELRPIENLIEIKNVDIKDTDSGLVYNSAHDIPLGNEIIENETDNEPLVFYSGEFDEYSPGSPDIGPHSPGDIETSLNEMEVDSEMSRRECQEDLEISIPFWSRFISLTYNVMELNRLGGNTDSSFQLTLGVLLCNVVFKKVVVRGANKICDTLQPFVSPVKLTSSSKNVLKRNCFTLTDQWVDSKSDKDLQCTASFMSPSFSQSTQQKSVSTKVNSWIHKNYNPNILNVIQNNLEEPYNEESLRLYYKYYFRRLDEICKKNSKKPALERPCYHLPTVQFNDLDYTKTDQVQVQHSLEPMQRNPKSNVCVRCDRYKRTKTAKQL